MFILRLLSSLFIISVVFSALFVKGIPGRVIFSSICVFLSFFAVYEYLTILSRIGKDSYKIFTCIFSSLILLSITVFSLIRPQFFFLLFALFVVISWIFILCGKERIKVIEKTIISLSGIFMVTFPLCFIAVLFMMGERDGLYGGRNLVLFLIAVTKMGDIGAYIIGISTSKLIPGGNHKISPMISPKKSWEGTIGGLVFSILASCILSKYLPLEISLNLPSSILMGVILFIGGFTGDLAESSLKRAAEIKDSGNIIPGIGGVLDLLDSLLLNAPIFFFYIVLS